MANLKVTPTFDNGVHDVNPIVDAANNSLAVQQFESLKIHKGKAFFAVYSAILNDTEFIEVRVQTPDTTEWAHMLITIKGALAGTAELWTPTTKTHAAANVMQTINRNFNSSNTTTLTICHTPAGAQAGDANLRQYFGATASGGRISAGGDANNRASFVLMQNSSYLIKCTSRVDGNAVAILLDWYEQTHIG